MTSKTIQIDRVFLKIFQAEKKVALLYSSKGMNMISKASKGILSNKSLETVQKFKELYLDQKHPKDSEPDVNDDVDAILEKTKNLIGQGFSNEQIEKIIRVDQESESLRLEKANLQKSLESAISMDKYAEKKLLPIIDSIKFTGEVQNRIGAISIGMMMVVNSLGSKFRDVLEDLATQIKGNIRDPGVRKTFVDAIYKGQETVDPDAFLSDFTSFAVDSLKWCLDQSDRELARITRILVLIVNDSHRRTNRVTDSESNLETILAELSAKNPKRGALNLKALDGLGQFASSQPELNELVSPLIEALKFQATVNRQLRNLYLQIEIWSQERGPETNSVTWPEDKAIEFGQKLLKTVSTKEESEIIKSNIKGLDQAS